MERILRVCRPRTPRLTLIPGRASQPSTVAYGSPANRPPASEAQKRLALSPFLATLTHSPLLNPFACHSYANTRDMGATLAPKFLPGPKDLTPGCSSTSFKINTCKTVSKQTTSSSFRINTYKKQGGRGGPGTDRPHP